MTKLSEIGEFGLIALIEKSFKAITPKSAVGIGDDCAVLPYKNQDRLLVTTDLLTEGVHFLKDKITPFELGHKSLAVNLSDIAAAGGKPLGAFLSIALPTDTSIEWANEFISGFRALAKKYNCPLLGGDTTKSTRDLFINVCVLGTVNKKHVKSRSAAQAGDVVCVTGPLGDSLAGLKIILDGEHVFDPEAARLLLDRHLLPEPHLNEGQWLSKMKGVHAMMDVSDGLASDLPHICERSKVGAEVFPSQIPMSAPFKTICQLKSWPEIEYAMAGGEDYVLMCTIAKKDVFKIQNAFKKKFKKDLFAIGRITRQKGIIGLHGQSFQHFDKEIKGEP